MGKCWSKSHSPEPSLKVTVPEGRPDTLAVKLNPVLPTRLRTDTPQTVTEASRPSVTLSSPRSHCIFESPVRLATPPSWWPVTGLPNATNTCFVNAAVLALLHTTELIPLLETRQSPVSLALLAVHRGERSVSAVTELLSHFSKFNDKGQHCAHSFLLDVFRAMTDSTKLATQNLSDSRIVTEFRNHRSADLFDVFGIVTQTRLSCYKCIQSGEQEVGSKTLGGFSWTMSLPIIHEVRKTEENYCFNGSDWYRPGVSPGSQPAYWSYIRSLYPASQACSTESGLSIDVSIRSVLRASLQSTEDLMSCAVCGCDTQHVQQSYIVHLPKVLVFHLQRYDLSVREKDTTNVSIPRTIGMEEYCKNTGKYDLFAVISHKGSLGGGHYWVNLLVKGSWYQYNDDQPRQKLLSKSVLNNDAYVLFYRRRDDRESSIRVA